VNDASNEPVFTGLCHYRTKSGGRLPIDGAAISHGQAAQVLAASKPGGLLLCVDAPELSFWLSNGMDITSKLVCLASDKDVCATLSECLEDDIRLTIHCQHAIAFLGDVRDHRFDLTVFSEIDAGLAELAVNSLAPGGILAVLPLNDAAPTEGVSAETILGQHAQLLLSPGASGALIAARISDQHLRKRRGGRRRRAPPDF